MDLMEISECSRQASLKIDLPLDAGSYGVQGGLGADQDIPPLPGRYNAVFVMLQGRATLRSCTSPARVRPVHMVHVGRYEDRKFVPESGWSFLIPDVREVE